MNSPLSPEFLKTVSRGPGIYQMLGEKELLYVGKAGNLRRRLAQHARCLASPQAGTRTAAMLAKVRRIEVILTATEKEALLLEASLIKQRRPRYNVALRDDKSYPMLVVTVGEEWPRLTVAHRRPQDGSRCFGPFSSAPALKEALALLLSLHPLRRCRTMQARSRPCLNHQLKRCLAPCAGLADKTAYKAMVDELLLILEGKSRQLLDRLRQEMERAADELNFEHAARCRDRIDSLTRTLERQHVAATANLDQDVFGLARQDAATGIAVLAIRSGLVCGARTFFLTDPVGNDAGILQEAILQLYSEQVPPPRELLLPLRLADEALVQERLAELRQGPVRLPAPGRDSRRTALLRTAADNAAAVLAQQGRKNEAWDSLAAAMQSCLNLSRRPDRIECMDVSCLAGKQAVGSTVCFVLGEKDAKSCFRCRIQAKDEPDDYAMMDETLRRRAKAWLAHAGLPDLLLLDGGRGQLGVAVKALAELGLLGRIDLAAIAKEKEDEGEKLFLPDGKTPVLLPRHSPVLLCLMRIRDEAHRHGISLHRNLRSQAALRSRLDGLAGVGPARRLQLLKALGSCSRVMAATADELAAVPGIGRTLAESICRQLHGTEPQAAWRSKAGRDDGPTTAAG